MIVYNVIESSHLGQKTTSKWFMQLIEGLARSGETLVNGVIEEIKASMGKQNQSEQVSNIFIG